MIRVMTRKSTTFVLLALLILPAVTVVAGDKEGPSSKEVKQMIKFGISLGKRGLWKEALYRWREALRHDPDNPKLLNNIAVALETQGDLEGARETYARAKELAGRARYLQRNIENFEELFTALEQYEAQYRKPPAGTSEDGETAVNGEAETDPVPAEDQAPVETDASGDPAQTAGSPEAEAAADAGESGPAPDPPVGDQPVEEVE